MIFCFMTFIILPQSYKKIPFWQNYDQLFCRNAPKKYRSGKIIADYFAATHLKNIVLAKL